MPQKTLVLHIGDPKTGSTSIQRTMFERRWTCPTVTMDYPNILNARVFAQSLREKAGNDLRDRQCRKTAEWISQSPADVVVLSSEAFCSVPAATVKAVIAQHFPECASTTKVIAYARPHASRLLSSYSQRVKTGLIKKSIDGMFANPDGLTIITLHKRFMEWRAVFGDQFILRPMVRSVLRGGDVVTDFVDHALNGAPFTLHGDTETNASTSAEALSGLRMIQLMLRDAGIGVGVRHSIGDRINDQIASANGPAGTKMRLHKSLYEKVVEQCRKDAEDMDTDFFDPPVMLPALIQAEKDTVAEKIPIDAAVYFAPDKLDEIRRLTKSVIDLTVAHPLLWLKAEKREKGVAAGTDPRKNKRRAKDSGITRSIDTHLSEISALLADI